MSMMLRRAMMMASSLVKHIISSVTGLVSFSTNVAADMPSVLCEFAPVQSGSGDPSPNNVRPITGWTGLTATRTGKNLAYLEQGSINVANGAETSSTTRVRTPFIRVEPGKTYVCSSENNGWDRRNGCLYDIKGQFIKSGEYPNGDTGRWTCPNNQNAAFWRVVFSHTNTSENCSPSDFWFQVEEAANATTFETYRGTSIPVDWQSDAGSVYGGTLDLVTGVLTVDWQSFIIDDSNTYTTTIKCGTFPYLTMRGGAIYANGDGIPKASNAVATSVNNGYIVRFANGIPGVTSDAEFTTFLANNPMQLVLKMKTPIATYQLTPAQIQSLIGTNNVWHDANGGITVEYYNKY